MSKKIINYRAYSEKNRDFREVYRENRLRGCKVGDPVLIYGKNIMASESRLEECRQRHIADGHTITNSRRGSFTVEVENE